MIASSLLKKPYFLTIASLILGFGQTLAFAPFHWFFLSWCIPALIFQISQYVQPKERVIIITAFGFSFGLSGLYWIYITLDTYAQMSQGLSLLGIGLIAFVFSLFFTLPLSIAYRLSNARKTQALVFFLLWWALEWLRSHALFGGFTWLILGYSQSLGPISYFAPFTGVYGLSLIVMIINFCLYYVIDDSKSRRFSTLLIACILALGMSLKQVHFTQAASPKIPVSLLQGNIPQSLKWDSHAVSKSLNRYQELNTQALKNSQIIIWPESAIPIFKRYAGDYLHRIDQEALSHKASVILGILTAKDKPTRFFNSAIALGLGHGQYDKHHLVPFGEYTPFSSLSLKIARALHIPMSELSAGNSDQKPLLLNNIPTAMFICYEVIFPNLVAHQGLDTQLMVTISDDTWYGHSIALNQHLQMAQLQAKTMQKYLLFDSNSGITAIITPNGEISKQLPIDTVGILNGHIQAIDGKTPFIWFNDHHLDWLIFILIIWFCVTQYRRKLRGEAE